MGRDGQKGMKLFLLRKLDVITWSTANMSGISLTVITHALNVSPNRRRVSLLLIEFN